MRIDFSEPECSTCFHYRTSGILNTQETEPSNVIESSSSVTSVPVSSEPVQAFGHDSADVGSTSTSSPLHRSSPFRFGTPPVITSVNSEPEQSLGSTSFNDGALVAACESMQAPVQVPFGSGASTTSTCSTSSPAHSSSPFRFNVAPAVTSVSSASPEALGPRAFDSVQAPAFGSGAIAAPIPSTFWSMQTPSFDSGASATSTSSTSSPFHSSSPTRFEFPPAVSSVSSEPAQAFVPNIFGSGAFAAPKSSIFGSMEAPNFGSGASATSTSSTSSPIRFKFGPAVTPVSSAPTQALGQTASGFGAFAGPTPPIFRSMQAPVQASAPNTSTSFSFRPAQDFGKIDSASASLFGNGGDFARPDVGISPEINTSTNKVVFGTTPVIVSSLFGPTQDFAKTSSVCAASTIPKSPFSSLFPGFGVGYLPGSTSNLFGVKTSSPQPFGFSPATTVFQSSSSSSPAATFSSNPNTGLSLFAKASYEWSRRTEEGSKYPRYTPTTDGSDIYISISASNSYQHKSHEEIRWEDYKKGDKGSRPNAVFSTSTSSPSLFGSQSIHDHPLRTTGGCTTQGNTTGSAFGFIPATGGTTSSSSRYGQTNPAFNGYGQTNPAFGFTPSSSSTSSTTFFAAPTSSSVQRPHETTAVSFPASGCTACGVTSSSSASGNLTFNVATTPPSAATSLPGLFFSTSGSCPMMFGTTPAAQATNPTLQAYPMMYGSTAQGTTPTLQAYPMLFGSTTLVAQGTNLAVQATAPALQAYAVHGYILLPFSAMSLQ